MATIKDVASRAGVSPAAVSKYLKTPDNMRETTRQRISEAIEELHYRPNQLARCLRTGQSGLIAIAIPEIDNPYFSTVFRIFQNRLADMGYLPIMLRTCSALETERTADLLKSGLIDGAICYDDGQIDAILLDEEISVPIIRMGSVTSAPIGVRDVLIDLHTGFELLCRRLSDTGVKTVGYIGPDSDSSSKNKLSALNEYCDKFGLIIRQDACLTGCYGYNGGYESCEKLLNSVKQLPDAIVCESDMIALGALKCLEHRRICVPDEVKLSGCDNTELSAISTPSLTSVDIPLEEICNYAVDMLMSFITGSKDILPSRVFRTGLKVRYSA